MHSGPHGETSYPYSGLLLAFYPIVPIFSLFALLWVGPQNSPERVSVRMSKISGLYGFHWSKSKEARFFHIEYLAMTARAIAGGVESPLQLAFQVSFIAEQTVTDY